MAQALLQNGKTGCLTPLPPYLLQELILKVGRVPWQRTTLYTPASQQQAELALSPAAQGPLAALQMGKAR